MTKESCTHEGGHHKDVCSHKQIGEILNQVNTGYFDTFDTSRGHHNPHLVCVACADARVMPALLLSKNPGDILLNKPLGGFLPKKLEDSKNLSAWFSLAVGMKKIPEVVLISHSDCAAGNMSLKYPSAKNLPRKHPEYKNIRSIQKYLSSIGADLPKLSKMVLEQAEGEEHAATDLMTKILSVFSLKNLMNYKVCENQSETVGQAVAAGKMNVVLIYIDLEKKSLEYFDSNTGDFVPMTKETPAQPTVLSEGKDNIGLFRHLPQPELPLPLPDPGKKEGGLSPPSFKNKGDLKF